MNETFIESETVTLANVMFSGTSDSDTQAASIQRGQEELASHQANWQTPTQTKPVNTQHGEVANRRYLVS